MSKKNKLVNHEIDEVALKEEILKELDSKPIKNESLNDVLKDISEEINRPLTDEEKRMIVLERAKKEKREKEISEKLPEEQHTGVKPEITPEMKYHDQLHVPSLNTQNNEAEEILPEDHSEVVIPPMVEAEAPQVQAEKFEEAPDYQTPRHVNEVQTVTKYEEDRSKSFLKWFLLALLLVGLIFGGIYAYKKNQERVRSKAYEEAYEHLKIEFNNQFLNDPPVLEAGDVIETTPEDGGMGKVPDFLRKYILTLPGDANITFSEIDTSKTGPQTVQIYMEMEDQFGKHVQRTQEFEIDIKDTKDATIILGSEEIIAKRYEDLLENVVSVVDPVFGEYLYSGMQENRTYYVDASGVDFETEGTYIATVIVYDNGKTITKNFDVIVEKKPEPTPTPEEKEDENSENRAEQEDENSNSESSENSSGNSNESTVPASPTPDPILNEQLSENVYIEIDGNSYVMSEEGN